MSSAEHLIENLILGMKRGRDIDDILAEPCNVYNLSDTSLTAEDAVRIACHVVYTLYDGKFPRGVEDKYTNFDHFKDMDEYDLASELQKNMHCNGCKLFRDGKYKCYLDDFTCIGRIIEWLREDYKND